MSVPCISKKYVNHMLIMAVACALQGAMLPASFSRASAVQSLRTHENMEDLRSNLKEEHILKVRPLTTGERMLPSDIPVTCMSSSLKPACLRVHQMWLSGDGCNSAICLWFCGGLGNTVPRAPGIPGFRNERFLDDMQRQDSDWLMHRRWIGS